MNMMYKVKWSIFFCLLMNTLILFKNIQIYGIENIAQHYTEEMMEYILISIASLISGWAISERRLKKRAK